MLINGKKIAEDILADVKVRAGALGRAPRLAMAYVEHDPRSRKYLEMKKAMAERVGIEARIYGFPQNITTQQLRKEIVKLAKSSVNDGLILEIPFPEHINTQYILNAMPQEKDPDVLSQKGQGAFFADRSKILPPSAETVKVIFDAYNIDPKGKHAVVFGHGILIGKPVAHWLQTNGATVTIVTEETVDPKRFSQDADIVIGGANKPNIITGDMVKEGAVVIDFGAELMEGKIVGNVVFDEVKEKAAYITPAVGGVGPIGIAIALRNLLILLKA